MSICVVTNPVGATAAATSDMLEILSNLTEVSLISANISEKAEIQDNYEIIEVSRSGTGGNIAVAATRFLINQIRMCQVLQNREEDIVWFFGATAYLLPLLFAKLLGKTVVLQPRGDVPLTLQLHWEQRIPATLAELLAGVVGWLEKIGYRLSDEIVTYTPAMAAELGLTRYEEKLHPNGARYIDTDRFYPHTEYTERDQIVGFLGRLDEEKGVRELANVAQQLPSDTKFVFAGDGDLREWLETELANEIDTGSVEMMGWVDREEVPAVLSRFKLLVLPSQPTEGLPTVILEAFACGTPVYATPVSGVPDVIRDKETGFIMGNVDTEIIIEEITNIFMRDDLSQISETSRQFIEDQYSFDAAVGRYRKILNDIQESE